MAPMKVIVPPEPRTKPGMMASLINPAWSAGSPATEGEYAEVEIDGMTFQVSKMPGETGWTADAAFRGSFPVWCNGFGARYLRTRQVTAEAAAMIEAAR